MALWACLVKDNCTELGFCNAGYMGFVMKKRFEVPNVS
jgi:hypothetical protein